MSDFTFLSSRLKIIEQELKIIRGQRKRMMDPPSGDLLSPVADMDMTDTRSLLTHLTIKYALRKCHKFARSLGGMLSGSMSLHPTMYCTVQVPSHILTHTHTVTHTHTL